LSATMSNFAGAQQGFVGTGFGSLFRMKSGGNARGSAPTLATPPQMGSRSRITSGVKMNNMEKGDAEVKGKTGDGTEWGGEAKAAEERPAKKQAVGVVFT
jgi:hypothetical protein